MTMAKLSKRGVIGESGTMVRAACARVSVLQSRGGRGGAESRSRLVVRSKRSNGTTTQTQRSPIFSFTTSINSSALANTSALYAHSRNARGVVICQASAKSNLTSWSRVLVTGAGGRTGKLVLKKLSEEGIPVRGLCRTEKSKTKVCKEMGLDESEVDLVVGDVSSAEDMKKAMSGCTHLVVLSSAKPQIKKRSLVRIMLKKLVRMDPGRPTFRWAENGEPEVVDYIGGKAQIDAAKAEGVDQILWVGSMGGTQSDNFLNTIGDGNILLWKRKAEEYLVSSAGDGMSYTIVHPGGLLDKPEGKRELKVDVDDKILDTDQRSVPRGDLANVVVSCLGLKEAYNVAFDLASLDEQEGEVDTDIKALLGSLEGKSYDYSLNQEDVKSLTVSSA